MNKKIFKDFKNRLKFSFLSVERVLMKALFYNTNFYKMRNFKFYLKSGRKAGRLTKLKNFCFITGNARSVSGYFGLARGAHKMLARSGHLPGVRKASW